MLSRLVVFLFVVAFAISLNAQQREVDSLKFVIERSREDSLKVNTLIELSKIYSRTSSDSAIQIANQAVDLARRLGYKSGEATALKWIGNAYLDKTNLIEAINSYKLAEAIYNSINDKKGVANIQSNMATLYFDQGDDVKALEFVFSALKTAEEVNDSLRMATVYNNIGAIYQNKRNTWDKAVEFYKKGLNIGELIHDVPIIAATTAGLSEFYLNRDSVSLDSAMFYALKSLEANKSTMEEPYSLNLLGQIYLRKRNFDKSVEYHKRAFDKAFKHGSYYYCAISKLRLGQAYKIKGELLAALDALKQAEDYAVKRQSVYYLKEIYAEQASIYSVRHDYLNAFKYQCLLTDIKDTIYDIDTDKKLQGIQFSFDIGKKESQIKLLTMEKEIQEQEINKVKLVKNGFISGFAVVLLFAGVFFYQRNKISKGKKRSDELLLNILPQDTAEELKSTGTAKARKYDSVSILFTDFKNFTQASEKLTSEELVDEINHCYSEFDKIISRHGIEKIKTIGDAYMCAGGLPVINSTHPIDIVKAGLEMIDFIERNKKERMKKNQPYFELRVGVHTGPVVAGIVGIKKFAYDIWGDAVNVASRMESSGEVGKLNVSGTTYEFIKDHFICIYRGKIQAKNKGEIDMYFVEGVR